MRLEKCTCLLFPLAVLLLGVFWADYVKAVGSLPTEKEKGRIVGKVLDELGEGMPGASITILGTNKGASTDVDGSFTIEMPIGTYTLNVNYIGYEVELVRGVLVKKGEATVVNVKLSQSSLTLNEVVVTAIGIKQEKKRLGYATQQLRSDVIEETKPINLGAALSGQISGLRVTNPTGIFQKPGISLRGNSPLIVVDGIPIVTDMFDVASEDVAGINILKGTSASALYGARGKNGAILITTKKAEKEGLAVKVNLSSMVTAGYTVFPKTQTEYGSGSEGKYEFWDGADGGISDGDMTWGPRFASGLKIKQWNSPIRNKKTGEVIPWWGDVKYSKYDDRSLYERVPIPFEQHDNLKEFMRMGVISQASVSLSSKAEKSNIYFSANFASQRGKVPNTSLKSGGLLFNYVVNPVKNLELSTKLSYNKVYSPNYPRYGYGPKNHIYTILLWMSDDVNIKELKKHLYRPDMYGYRQANYNYAWYNNPYFMARESKQVHDRDVLSGQLKASWNILPQLTVQGRTSARMDKRFEDRKIPKSYMNYGDSRNGDYKNWNSGNLDVNSDILITYDSAINDNITITANAGSSMFYNKHTKQYQSTDGLIVPRVYSLSNTNGPVMASNYLSEKEIFSLYGSVNLDLYRALFLTITGRNDWSSTLPDSQKSYFYPSVSLSSILSSFIDMSKYVDFLKVYGSWAKVSNDLDPYNLQATYDKGVMYNTNQSVSYPGNLSNMNIAPEKTTSFEVGIATSFLKKKLSMELTYYYNIDENQIINLPVSKASGFSSRKVNGNVYKTNGFEIMLGAKPITNNNFQWSLSANFSGRVKKLTEIYGGKEVYDNLRVGDRADAIYTRVWMKSADGQLILDEKGMPIKDSYYRFVGNALPDYLYGLQNTFKIKDIKINLDLDGAIGGTLVSTTHKKLWWAGKHPNSTTYRDEEYAAGKPIYVPEGVVVTGGDLKTDVNGNVVKDTRTYKKNTTAVSWQSWSQNYPYRAAVTEDENKEFANTFSTSFLKLRRVAVSYDMNKLINSPHIGALDLTLFANNLFVLKDMPLLDPDFGSKDNGLQDPSARYIGISASIKF